MNSPFAKIFLAIMTRINDEVPEINYIDQDLGQLEGNGIRPAVAFPCALIDFQGWTFSDLGQLSQLAEGNVTVKLGFAQFSDSSSLNDPLWREFSLEYFDLEWKIHEALQGWSPGADFGNLTRTSADSENAPKAIRKRPIIYRLEFEDHSTKLPTTTVTPPAPVISN